MLLASAETGSLQMLVLTSTVRSGDLVMRKSWIKCGMMVSAITMLGIVAMVTSAEAQQQDVLRIEGAPDVSTVSASSASTSQDSVLQEAERMRVIRSQQLRALVDRDIKGAMRVLRSDPTTAIQDLKRDLQTVMDAADVEADVRNELTRRLRSALLEANRQQLINEQERIASDQRRAAAEERRRTIDTLARDQERLNQLMEQFRSLMIEERYREAEVVARRTESEYLQNRVPKQALEVSEVVGNLTHIIALRFMRQDRFVETLTLAEDAHIAFPDEPPIVYPTPEIWNALSARRVERYASVSLEPTSESERRAARAIRNALNEPAIFSFTEGTTLETAMDFIQGQYDINVNFDLSVVEEVGTDVDVEYTASGNITLRSALKNLLEPHELTYWVSNESLVIGTEDEAENNLLMKTYSVGDLVIPPSGGMGGGMGADVLKGGFLRVKAPVSKRSGTRLLHGTVPPALKRSGKGDRGTKRFQNLIDSVIKTPEQEQAGKESASEKTGGYMQVRSADPSNKEQRPF